MSYFVTKGPNPLVASLIRIVFLALTSVAQTEVFFPDPNLEDLVRWALDKAPEEAILDIHMAELVPQRSLQGDGIRALDGLKHAVNLYYLVLPDNDIQNLRPLAELAQLQYLDFAGNQVPGVDILSAAHMGHSP